jgi:hypothetical protein
MNCYQRTQNFEFLPPFVQSDEDRDAFVCNFTFFRDLSTSFDSLMKSLKYKININNMFAITK